MTYMTFFVLGFILYASIPDYLHRQSGAVFVGFFCIILSMYGGGFATVPAYLSDLFGQMVAIHGRLWTAWSRLAWAVFSGCLREAARAWHRRPGVQHHDVCPHGLLVIGLSANLIRRR
jgi:hypothetical protein